MFPFSLVRLINTTLRHTCTPIPDFTVADSSRVSPTSTVAEQDRFHFSYIVQTRTMTVERAQVINFGAGPSALPDSVLEEAAKSLLNFQGTGIGITEISHRSKEFGAVVTRLEQLIRKQLDELYIEIFIDSVFDPLSMSTHR